MCWGVEYFRDGERVAVYFDQRAPLLPVRLRNGRIAFVKWGARRAGEGVEDDTGPGHIKTWREGGWVALESIGEYAWQKFDPRPVKIAAARFVVPGEFQQARWVELKRGEYLQGLLATAGSERRVYVVTVPAPDGVACDVWPRIVTSARKPSSDYTTHGVQSSRT